MPDRSHIARIALSQDGVREEGGNNCGPKIVEYQAATWLKPAPWPWCAAFVDWCIREWIRGLDPRDPLFAGKTPEAWRPLTAGALDLENWGKSRGLKILGRNADVEAGDIVTFDMGHCGIVTASRVRTAATILTVEGNTGPEGKRDAASGDGVFQKKRPRTLVHSFIRLERESA